MNATPRPWKLEEYMAPLGAARYHVIGSADNRESAYTLGYDNARAIVRAVNSFDAMKEALEKVDRWITAHPHKATLAQSVKDEIKAALVLAKGEER